jgi:alkylation response protein AidB-like acyl-CoA dehydrogenase
MKLEQPPRPARQTDSAEEQAILDAIQKWLDKDVRPKAAKLEHDDVWPAEMVEQMKAFGLFGAVIDPKWGGLGLSASTYAKIVSRISEVWMSLTGIFNSHLMMAILVEKFGTDEQQRRWLPKMSAGEIRGGLALTEPDCGTDLAAVRTRAVREGDHYVVNGTKTWISNGIQGSAFAVLVKTNPDAHPARKGLSMFIMEKGAGFAVSRKLEKLGYKGIDSAELVFDGFKLPAANRIGEEGQGFYLAVSGLELGRINVAARGVGIAKAALDESVRYAQLRKTFGKPICEHQAIQLKLGEMATRAEAARLLVEGASQAYDAGRRCDMEAGMAKYFATEAALENSVEAMRIHGGYGYSKEFPIERLYRDAPLLCIGEGTNEMQRIIIARQLVERNRV